MKGKKLECKTVYNNDELFINALEKADNDDSERTKCAECLNKSKKSKKTHYTVRRAPGQISHLLSSQPATDLFTNYKCSSKSSQVSIHKV
jgi:hypothetical protein